MANPRQRRKARSSTHKPVKQSRRANKMLKKHRPIQGSKVLQEGWDSKKTVRQNYAALGLAHRLDPTDSGGQDITHLAGLSSSPSHQSAELSLNQRVDVAQSMTNSADHREQGPGSQKGEGVRGTNSLRAGTGRIIRDETGAIVDVVLAEGVRDEDGEVAGSESMEIDEDRFEIGSVGPRGSEKGHHGQEASWLLRSVGEAAHGREDERTRAVVQALEAEASLKATKTIRTTSASELKYLKALQQAYGADFESMARDRKRNVQQYSVGQLRRAFEKAGL